MTRSRELGWFAIMLAPALVGFLWLTAGPMAVSFYMSLTRFNLASPHEFIGLQNYRYLLLMDPSFFPSVWVTLLYTIVSVPLNLLLALAIGLLLNRKGRFIGLFRTIYFLPSLLPATASALIWVYIFQPAYGLLNTLLAHFGVEGPSWTLSPRWALPTLILMSLWGFGGAMIVFLAGLQGIPRQLYEAAELDGAGRWRQFRHVTLPVLSPVLFFNLIMGLIGALKVFDQAYTFGNTAVPKLGGPGRSTLFYVLNLYQKSFVYFHMGLGCAMAWMLFLTIVFVTWINFRIARKWVHS